MHKFLTHPRTLCTAIALVFSMPAMSEEVPVISTLAKSAPTASTSTTASSLNIPTLIPSLPTTSITPAASAPVTTQVTPSVALTQTLPAAPIVTLTTAPAVVSTTTPTPTAVITPVPAASFAAPSVATAIAPAALPSVAVPNVTSAIAPVATVQPTITPLIPLPSIVATTPATPTPASSISITTPSATQPAVAEMPRVASAESQMSPQQAAELPRNILVPPAVNIDTDDPLAIQIKAIDRSDISARITLLGKYARHYPPHFETKRARRAAEIEAVDLANVTNDAANASKPTFEQLIQAVKANCLAHNMDVGNNTAGNANTFIRQALKLKPNDGEANFLYGVLLSESGGMKEGLPYLNKSAKVGFNEAYLSLANAYLSLNQKPKALAALSSYKKVVPNDTHYEDMVDAIKTNKASIW